MATTRPRLTGRYADRAEAGRALGDAVAAAGPLPRPVVLALPRGGVPVAAEVAARLLAPLEVIVVRKIGAPGRPELAMGALAMIGPQVSLYRNEDIISALGIGEAAFEAAHERELAELRRRGGIFSRADATPVPGADVVLVDDGLATGSTMLAAVAAVRGLEPARVVVAVPVASRQAAPGGRAVADEVICPVVPARFVAVGLAYADFHQLTDQEVDALLESGVGLGDVGLGPVGQQQQVGVAQREDRVRDAAGRPELLVVGEGAVDQCSEGCGCPTGATPPIGWPVWARTNSAEARCSSSP